MASLVIAVAVMACAAAQSVSSTPAVSRTPSRTPSRTTSVTPTLFFTLSVTPSVSATGSETLSPGAEPSSAVTPTTSRTPSRSPSVSASEQGNSSVSVSPSVTRTVARTPRASVTTSSTVTASPESPSCTPSNDPSVSVTPSNDPTSSISPSVTPSPIQSVLTLVPISINVTAGRTITRRAVGNILASLAEGTGASDALFRLRVSFAELTGLPLDSVFIVAVRDNTAASVTVLNSASPANCVPEAPVQPTPEPSANATDNSTGAGDNSTLPGGAGDNSTLPGGAGSNNTVRCNTTVLVNGTLRCADNSTSVPSSEPSPSVTPSATPSSSTPAAPTCGLISSYAASMAAGTSISAAPATTPALALDILLGIYADPGTVAPDTVFAVLANTSLAFVRNVTTALARALAPVAAAPLSAVMDVQGTLGLAPSASPPPSAPVVPAPGPDTSQKEAVGLGIGALVLACSVILVFVALRLRRMYVTKSRNTKRRLTIEEATAPMTFTNPAVGMKAVAREPSRRQTVTFDDGASTGVSNAVSGRVATDKESILRTAMPPRASLSTRAVEV